MPARRVTNLLSALLRGVLLLVVSLFVGHITLAWIGAAFILSFAGGLVSPLRWMPQARLDMAIFTFLYVASGYLLGGRRESAWELLSLAGYVFLALGPSALAGAGAGQFLGEMLDRKART